MPIASESNSRDGFSTVYKPRTGKFEVFLDFHCFHLQLGGRRFADLIHHVANVDRNVRIRFTSAHPKDFPTSLLQVIADNVNVCKQV
jgi:tRNA A37 methylthiotransferase MiaB